ncbi:MAG TPA: UbiA family prenyltransferase [Chthoniobacterales bacterium]|jgi:4-hydroxybenzoate polyprenyltransferase|nr:UbiA family prenyltransferase [Chthoniobacterales bacterium]
MQPYLSVIRPDHWLKNIFILFGHAAAIVLLALPIHASTFGWIVFSLVPACLMASVNYIINEILDAPFDREHPVKKFRAVPAGLVSIPLLWGIAAVFLVVAFGLSIAFFNLGYTIALGLLLLSGIVYNIPPIRLKDRAFLDVLTESFNNPIRLWLGWYALAPAHSFPPMSVVIAWWMFGALLMAGKRFAEFRFINDGARSARYRKSFATYTENSLVISMITYTNFFCFCAGAAVATYRPNLVFIFPVLAVALIVYFNQAMTAESARLEPEQLMRNPKLIACTIASVAAAAFLAWYPGNLTAPLHLFQLIPGE